MESRNSRETGMTTSEAAPAPWEIWQHSLVAHTIKTTEASNRSRMDGTHIIPGKRDSVHFASSSNTSA